MTTIKTFLVSLCLTILVFGTSYAQPTQTGAFPAASGQAAEIPRAELVQQLDLILKSIDSNPELVANQGDATELRALLLQIRKELQNPVSQTQKTSIDLQRLQEIVQGLSQSGL